MPKKKQYQIVNARVEVLSGGPEPGIVVAELELLPQTAKGKPFFLTIDEVDGMPTIFKTETSVFDWFVNQAEHESDLIDLQNKASLYEGEGYAELFENHKGIECYDQRQTPQRNRDSKIGRRRGLGKRRRGLLRSSFYFIQNTKGTHSVPFFAFFNIFP